MIRNNKANKNNITSPLGLARRLVKLHKSGEIELPCRALLVVAAVLDKPATDGQLRVLVKEAEKYNIKLGFSPRYKIKH